MSSKSSMNPKSNVSYVARFFKSESAGGILLIAAAALALLLANSPADALYQVILGIPVEVRIGTLDIAKPLLLWVNDGLMAMFFLLIGLELKREVVEGELSDIRKIILPGLGALGGMAVPAAIYIALNTYDPVALGGWAIPAATDIAFALGVLSLLGSRVPVSIKVFLASLAIFDDIGAILIIAFFYAGKISLVALCIALVCIVLLFILNRYNVVEKSPYLFIGAIMWIAMLKSGVHATLTGVILAMFIPLHAGENPRHSPLKSLESDLHAVVAFLILPVFAFCNAGVNLRGVSLEHLFHSVPLGIALGLFLGKQIGVFLFCWLGIKLRLAKLPDDVNWLQLYGTAVLCGIGFTMSLFIGSLAFEGSGVNKIFDERLGILLGSFVSGVLGYFILRNALSSHK